MSPVCASREPFFIRFPRLHTLTDQQLSDHVVVTYDSIVSDKDQIEPPNEENYDTWIIDVRAKLR